MRLTGPVLLCGLALLACVGQAQAVWQLKCSAPAKGNPVISYSPLVGQANVSDSAWHDETWAFYEFGPITEMEVYHSGNGWHDPYIGFHPGGEFKGIRASYGGVTNNDTLLFGARKPHKPFHFTLEAGEKIIKVEIQHDHVMRWMAFTTNLGHRYEWGFKDMPNTKSVTEAAPRDGAYLAAFRGYEGKQLPRELGGYKKRYIIQVGLVWAMPDCSAGYEWVEPSAGRGSGIASYIGGLLGGRPSGTAPDQRPPKPEAPPPPQRLEIEAPPVLPEAAPEAAPAGGTPLPVATEAARMPAPSKLVSGRRLFAFL